MALNDATCACGCSMAIPQAFNDAYTRSRYNAYPCQMWWRSMEVLILGDDLESCVERGWLEQARRFDMRGRV